MYFPKLLENSCGNSIFKAGDKTLVENHRPNSILPVISKVAEKRVAKQLTTHLSKGHTTLHPMQFGFRRNQPTAFS